MKLTINGTEYQASMPSMLRLTIGEARAIKSHTGLSIADWRLGLMTLNREDPDVLAGLVVLLKYRAGEGIELAELDALNTDALVGSAVFEDNDREYEQVVEDDLSEQDREDETPADQGQHTQDEPRRSEGVSAEGAALAGVAVADTDDAQDQSSQRGHRDDQSEAGQHEPAERGL